MEQISSAHYEGDPRYGIAADEDAAYRRDIADQFGSRIVDAIMHGETIDGHGRVVVVGASKPDDDIGQKILGPGEYVNPLDIVEADEAREAEEWRGGDTYDGIRDAMRRDVGGIPKGSRNPKRRINPEILTRPSHEQMHRLLSRNTGGRPLKGSRCRVHVTARIDPSSREAYREAGMQLGEVLDMVASYIHRGMTSTQIREALREASFPDSIAASNSDLGFVPQNQGPAQAA